MPTDEQIKQLAYSLWEKEGRPEGKDTEHYFTAKKMLEERETAKGHVGASRSTATAPRSTTAAPSSVSHPPRSGPRAKNP